MKKDIYKSTWMTENIQKYFSAFYTKKLKENEKWLLNTFNYFSIQN